jgi:hypothetical protein
MSAREIARRFLLGSAVGLVATVMYHGTQYLGATRALVRADCWAWRWVPFHVAWFWPYVSVFVLMAGPWFLLRQWTSVRHFALALIAMAAVGWVIFVIYPTACVRPNPAHLPSYVSGLYELDWANNCFPCLHSALAVIGVYGVCGGQSRLTSPGPRMLVGVWTVAILISILGVRQHTGIDTFAGMVLGAAAIALFRCLESRRDLADEPIRS